MELLLLLWFACGIAASVIAGGKGHSGCLWFGLGILFGPLGLLAAAVAPRDVSSRIRDGLAQGYLRICPHCDEAIRVEAKVCKHCQRDVPPPRERTTMEMLRGAPKR